jgi:diguanylate cyclase (GGDEF)-like protein/PAS domain S-box-containing protein
MIDANGSIRMANKAAEKLFGFEAGELVGEPVERLVPMRLGEAHAAHRKQFVGHPSARPMGSGRELTARRKDGSEIPVEIGLNPIEDHDGVQVLCSVVNLTARKEVEQKTKDLAEELERANQRLTELAATDPLTGLRNRRALLEELEIHLQLARRHRRSISLILVDVDHFKEHNDCCGHLAGDEALRRVGEILCGTARSSDFVGRYGGDEFVICLPETDPAGAMLLAERFRSAIAEHPWPSRGITLSLGASTVSFTGNEGPTDASETTELLLREADRALYQSKAAGRNQATHSDSLRKTENGGDD